MNTTRDNPVKQILTTLSVAIICLLLSLYFPASSPFEKITGSISFLFVIPAFYIKFILKKNLSDFGLNFKNKAAGILGGIAAILGIFLLFWLGQKYSFLNSPSQIPAAVSSSFLWFLFYELILINISLFCAEFFFRGFLLFSFSPKFAFWTIAAQALLSGLTSASSGFVFGIFFQSTAIAFILGFLAFRSRSFMYSYGIILLANILIDAWLIRSLG